MGAITHVVAEVLSRLSGCVTGSIIASGMEALSSTQEETQTFYQTGVPACGGLPIFAFIYASASRSAGGRMSRTWCLSTHILSQNMEPSGHIS